MLIMMIPCMVTGTILARFSIRGLVNPIVAISEATKEVAKGNFGARLQIKSHVTEVQEMAENFSVMTQELQNTETLRNDFVSNVSHEFKTPLAAIEGYTMLLQDGTLSQEKRDFYLDKILLSTKRLSTMTGNILWLSRLENQEINTEKARFSLDEQLREILLMLEAAWTEKKVDLDIDLEAVDFYGNQELLSQVWQNLIGNALKFVGEGGLVRIILRQNDSGVQVIVSDNGIGITQDAQNRIFEKFYQEDTSHATDGNGLGLTMVKRVVELHSGTIAVSSKPGKGSTFTVNLPQNAN